MVKQSGTRLTLFKSMLMILAIKYNDAQITRNKKKQVTILPFDKK